MLNRFRSEQAESSAGERNEFMGGCPEKFSVFAGDIAKRQS